MRAVMDGEIACAIVFERFHVVSISMASNNFRVASVAIEKIVRIIYASMISLN
jgi:hypothetical protein